jgi:hypothetical protein
VLNRTRAPLLLALLGCGHAAYTPTPNGETYRDCGGGFSVAFPRNAAPLIRESMVEDDVRGLHVSRNLVDAELSVSWSSMPADVVKEKSPQQVLRDVQRARLGKNEIVDEEHAGQTSSGAYTLEYTFHRAPTATAKDAPAEGRVLLVLARGTVLYQVQALGVSPGIANRREAKELTSSFQVSPCE